MELNLEQSKLRDEACKYIEENKSELIQKFILDKNPLRLGLLSIFMAGSPGAGKTEFSKRYLPTIASSLLNTKVIKQLNKLNIDITSNTNLIIRLDVDEIRDFIPQYQKTDLINGIQGNSEIIQKAAGKGIEILRNYCLDNDISFLHDGTFANYDTMKDLIKKSINKGREVYIFYIYIDPLSAWRFTQAREALEGRNINKENFINQYFNSQVNVNRIREKFGDSVKINFVLKNSDNIVENIQFNIEDLPSYLQFLKSKGKIEEYNRDLLETIL